MPFVAMSLYPDVQIPACHRHKDLKAMNEVFNAILDNATLFDCMKPLESTEFLGRALETFTEKRLQSMSERRSFEQHSERRSFSSERNKFFLK